MEIALLILCGLVIGFILVSLGMGAALYIGSLTAIFKLADKTAAATALVTTLPALLIGTYLYYREHAIDFHHGNQLIFWAVLGTIGGSWAIPYIDKKYYKIIVSVILIALALTILYKAWLAPHLHEKHQHRSRIIDHIIAYFASVISGIMIGLAGMSGGGPLVAGMLLLDAPIARAAATSSYVRIWTTMLGIGLHWHVMTIAWQPAIFMMIGTACGAVLAPFIMDKLGGNRKEAFSKFMKPLIALILLFMGIKPLL